MNLIYEDFSFLQIAKETADKFAKGGSQEHIPLGKSMIAMAIKAISVAGMGRSFMDEKEVDKLAAVYDVVRLLYIYSMLLDSIKKKIKVTS